MPQDAPPEQIRRTIALVVDDLSLSFESAYQTQKALKKFVDEQMQDGDLVAIIRTGAGIGALQQFTSDKRILYAAIEKVKWNPWHRWRQRVCPDRGRRRHIAAGPIASDAARRIAASDRDRADARGFSQLGLCDRHTRSTQIYRHRHGRIAGPKIRDPVFRRI